MGVAVYVVIHLVGGPTGVGALVRLVSGTVVGVAVYGVAVIVLRVGEVNHLLDRLLRRRRAA